MAFEIFIEPELETLQEVDNSAEWAEICAALDLKGQNKLSERSELKVGPPYAYIDERTERIIRTLCPDKSPVADYNASTIPLDVLKEIKRCKDNGWYDDIHIFFDNASPDPFVVGTIKMNEWQKCYHMIARWGAELLPFEILERKAIERLRNDAAQAIHELQIKVNYAKDNLDAFLSQALSGKSLPSLDFRVQSLNW